LNRLYELLVSFYFWYFVFLIFGLGISFVVLARNRKRGIENFPTDGFQPIFTAKKTRKKRKPKPKSKPKFKSKSKSAMSEKLGERIVGYMIEVSRSDSKQLVQDRISRIRSECERLSTLPLPEENKRIISSVLIWSKRFNVEKHITEMTLYRHSTQIKYDAKKRDFKLMIFEE
jgi:hypothetical protein